MSYVPGSGKLLFYMSQYEKNMDQLSNKGTG